MKAASAEGLVLRLLISWLVTGGDFCVVVAFIVVISDGEGAPVPRQNLVRRESIEFSRGGQRGLVGGDVARCLLAQRNLGGLSSTKPRSALGLADHAFGCRAAQGAATRLKAESPAPPAAPGQE